MSLSRFFITFRSLQKRPLKGMTIMELLLYMGLLALFLTILTQMFLTSLDIQLESEANASVDQDGKYILARLNYDIARASSITIPSTSGSQAATLELIANGVTYQYALTGANLTLTDNTGSYRLNGVNSRITGLQFVRRGNAGGRPAISVSFAVRSTITQAKGEEAQIYQTTFGTR